MKRFLAVCIVVSGAVPSLAQVGWLGSTTITVTQNAAARAYDAYLDFDTKEVGKNMTSQAGFPFVGSFPNIADPNGVTLFYQWGGAPPAPAGVAPGARTWFQWLGRDKGTFPDHGEWWAAGAKLATMPKMDLHTLKASWDGAGWDIVAEGNTSNYGIGVSIASGFDYGFPESRNYYWNGPKLWYGAGISNNINYPANGDGPISGSKHVGYIPIQPNSDSLAVAEAWVGTPDVTFVDEETGLTEMDYMYAALALVTPKSGDANTDAAIDFNDLTALSQHYNMSGTTWQEGDFNGDHLTDFSDLVLLSQNYNTGYGFGYEQTSGSAGLRHRYTPYELADLAGITVPEPSALACLLSLVGLPLAARRGRRA